MRRGPSGNVSHPTDSLPDMSYLETFQPVLEPDVDPYADPFADPVRYLGEYGIEAELVAEVARLPEAA